MAALHAWPTLLDLRNYGLLNFFKTHNKRRQARLLEYLIGKWDPDIPTFWIRLTTLEIDLKDIYFLTGLSKRGGSS